MATARTLSNLIFQNGTPVEREIIVVSDGPSKLVRKVVHYARKVAETEKQPVTIEYLWTPTYNATGNVGRALGLKAAKKDWVLFIDSGTSVFTHAFAMMDFALQDKPDSEMIMWDIIQMVDPVPFVYFSLYLKHCVEFEKIGYWVPGVSAAIKREIGQQVEWPKVLQSDWKYWCDVWKLLKKPVKLSLIQHPLVIAYGAYDHKRFRALQGPLAWDASNFDKDYNEVAHEESVPKPADSRPESITPANT